MRLVSNLDDRRAHIKPGAGRQVSGAEAEIDVELITGQPAPVKVAGEWGSTGVHHGQLHVRMCRPVGRARAAAPARCRQHGRPRNRACLPRAPPAEGRPCDGPLSWGIRTDVTYRSLTSPARARHSKPSLPGPASNQPPPHAIEHTMRGTSGWACAVAGWRSHQALRGLEQLPTARFLRMRASSTTRREAYIQERRMKNPASILTGLNATQYTTLMSDT